MRKLFGIIVFSILLNIGNIFGSEYVYPSGGEEFNYADTIAITWNSNEIASPVKIDIWNLNTLSYTNIADNLFDTTYNYVITNFTDDATLRIRITSLTGETKPQYSMTYFNVAGIPSFKQNLQKPEELLNTISVFPNPTYGVFSIANLDIQKIEIYNAQGMFIKSFTGINNDIDISELPAGQYNLIIYLNDNSIINSAIIKL